MLTAAYFPRAYFGPMVVGGIVSVSGAQPKKFASTVVQGKLNKKIVVGVSSITRFTGVLGLVQVEGSLRDADADGVASWKTTSGKKNKSQVQGRASWG